MPIDARCTDLRVRKASSGCGCASSATTTIENARPCCFRFSSKSQTRDIRKGCSGTRITSAPPGDASRRRNPAGMTTHHFDDHDAVMRFRSGMQTIDGVGNDRNCGVESERVVSAADVVVDCLGNSDERELMLFAKDGGQPRATLRRQPQSIHPDDALASSL